MDITINKLHREKDVSETLSRASSSDRPKFWTIFPFCAVKYRSYRSLLNKPSRCQSCYLKFLANEAPVIVATPGEKTSQTTLSTTEKTALSQNHVIRRKNQLQLQKAQSPDPSSGIPKFWTMCPFCTVRYRLYRRREFLNKPTSCLSCKKKFIAVEYTVQGPTPGKNTSLSSLEKRMLIQKLRDLQPKHPVASNCRPSFWTMCPYCECRYHYLKAYINRWFVCQSCKKDTIAMDGFAKPGEMTFSSFQQKKVTSKNQGAYFSGKESVPGLSCAVKIGEKRKRNECGEISNTDSHSKSEDVIVDPSKDGIRRVSDGIGEAGEESESRKQLHKVDHCNQTLPNAMNRNGQLSRKQGAQVGVAMVISQNLEADKNSGFCDTSSKVAEQVQPRPSECADPKLQQQKKVPSKIPGTHFSGKESSQGLSCAVKAGEKRKRSEYVESCNTENHSKTGDVIGLAGHDKGRGFDDYGDEGRGEELGLGRQLHEVDHVEETLPNVTHTNQKWNKNQDALGSSENLEVDKNSGLRDSGSGGAVQRKVSECADPKLNDFDKLREDANFEVGQTWALYDTADGMPRLYARIRKVSAPCFGLRITYLEPDPDDEKEIQWFEEDLPVAVGKFRLGESQNTNDRSKFSHVIRCSGGSISHFNVFPRKGETWALFKNWDINWSSEPDSHRTYEYEFVEILADYVEVAGVSVAFLHKAKGFASVFFRVRNGVADIYWILPHSLYRFSHRVPSFKLTGMEGKGVPKDAYELDQAALPETIEENTVPFHLLVQPKPKPKALCFPRNGKVFQTGQIWSFYSGSENLPLYYGRIQRITLTQVFEEEAVIKLSVSRLKANPFPENVIQWEDKKMPVGCGTFSMKVTRILTSDDVSHQIVPQTSMDGNVYVILPKIGDVWAIYRFWTCDKEFKDMGSCNYDIVEVLDDTLDYKVIALEAAVFSNEAEDKDTYLRTAESRHPDYDHEDGSEVIFTIPRSKMLRFSHQIPASRVTKEIKGDLKEVLKADTRALPTNVRFQDH
ncbi:hypothetical protein V5N11_013845 [Cardamine amara subsp. amara]|uniref:DUF3444 domain-containing protein n=1 Tax=Cardamine amara subsp. amara TaxID=228776 RepID=A0ABD1AR30_CARAN